MAWRPCAEHSVASANMAADDDKTCPGRKAAPEARGHTESVAEPCPGPRAGEGRRERRASDHYKEQQRQEQQQPDAEAGSPSPPSALVYEQAHVHGVYEAIAAHFSSTRHRPWPLVADFLRARDPGSVGLDVGCGNGKYLGVNPDVVLLGADRSAALAGRARDHGGRGRGEVVVADGLALPFRPGAADFAICVAVVHHLSTRERRQDGIRRLLECVRDDGGEVLVYVWALEQAGSRRGWDEGGEQDLLVPWVVKGKGTTAGEGPRDATFQRYYHLYRRGELEEDVTAAGGMVVGSGYEKDNWWAICSRQQS